MRTCLLLMVIVLCACQVNGQTIVDFEDLPVDAVYYVGEGFQSCGIAVTIDALSSGYLGGSCTIKQGGYAGGSGNEAWVGNVMLHFDFGSVTGISVLFGNYGGYNKVEVNGDVRQITNLLDLDGVQIGGVNAFVTQSAPSGNVHGSLTLSGPINSFAIGGQEFAIDDVTAVPEPSALASLLAAITLLAGLSKAHRIRA